MYTIHITVYIGFMYIQGNHCVAKTARITYNFSYLKYVCNREFRSSCILSVTTFYKK